MCEICGQTPCLTRCPNYRQRSNFHCCYCKEGIFPGEEYLSNCDGQYIHRDCIPNSDFVIDWLGYEIKEMTREEAEAIYYEDD